jgi:opacity protein-like surface antigen
MIKQLSLAAVLAAAATLAQANPINPIYVGLGIGEANHYTSASGTATKALLGYSFDPRGDDTVSHAIELSALHSGKNAAAFDAFGLAYKASYNIDALAFNVRLGGVYTDARLDGAPSKSTFGFTGGFGLSYRVTKNWAVTADWDGLPVRFSPGATQHVNAFTLGAIYHF